MERINVTKRVFRIGIFSNRGKSLRGPKKKKKGKNKRYRRPSKSFASRQIGDNIVQVVTNSRLPIRPPLYPGEKSPEERRRQNLDETLVSFRHAYVNWRGEDVA